MTLTCNIFTFIACTTNRNQFGKQFHVCIPQPKARKLSHLNPLAAKPKFENFKVMWGWHSCCQSCPGAWLPWLLPQCRLSRSPACYLLTFHILFHDVRISYAAKQHIRIHTYMSITTACDDPLHPLLLAALHLPQPTTFCHNFWCCCCCLAEAKQKGQTNNDNNNNIKLMPSFLLAQLCESFLAIRVQKFVCSIVKVLPINNRLLSAFSQLDCTHVCCVV